MHRSLRSLRHPTPLRPLDHAPSRTPTRTFTFLLPHPQLRSYAAHHTDQPPPTTTTTTSPTAQLKTQTFGRLSTWCKTLDRTTPISILIRDHETQHFEVQSSLLTHALHQPDRAQVKIQSPPKTNGTWNLPILDLTPFDPNASFIFLFWLYNRRLPDLGRDCDVPSEVERKPPAAPGGGRIRTGQGTGTGEKRRRVAFRLGLVEAWILGARLRASGFQNDVLRRLAGLLLREEEEAWLSSDPGFSAAIFWARRAFEAGGVDGRAAPRGMGAVEGEDACSVGMREERERDVGMESSSAGDPQNGIDRVTDMIEDALDDLHPPRNEDEDDIGRPLREFAVDVAAKRVHDVGYDGLVLTKSERRDLSGNRTFAAEVFAGLGGQIGTGGVLVTDMVKAYLVEERL